MDEQGGGGVHRGQLDFLQLFWHVFSDFRASEALNATEDGPSAPRPLPEVSVPSGARSSFGAAAGAATPGADVDHSGARWHWGAADGDFSDRTDFWTFLTSKYAISLVIMGVLVNRIQHICRPRGRAARLPDWRRLAIRMPALLSLGYCTFILGTRVLQLWRGTTHEETNWLLSTISRYIPWPDLSVRTRLQKSDEPLLWITFVSACLGVATESLTRSLEGTPEPSATFNLMSFSITLQAYYVEPNHVSLHFMTFVFLEIAEIFCLIVMGTFRQPYIRRLHVTTAFGLVAAAHYLLTPSHNRPIVSGFNRMPDVVLLGVVLVTLALHTLAQLVLDGSVDRSRLLFSSSNFPSLDDDYALALFKLGSACLRSTRLNGLSQDLATINVPEQTYVEIDDMGGARVRYGVDVLKQLQNGRLGLQHEIRATHPSRHQKDYYESALLPHPAKQREMIRFVKAIGAFFADVVRYVVRPLPRIRIGVPRSIYRILRLMRLAWHGQNGERRRDERIAKENDKRRLEKQAALVQKQYTNLLLELVSSCCVIERRGNETQEQAAWRAVQEAVRQRSGGEVSDDNYFDSMVEMVMERLRLPTRARLALEAGTEAEEEDSDWSPDEEGDSASEAETEDERASASTAALERSRRSRSRSRSVFSPTPSQGYEESDAGDEDEATALLQLARLDFAGDSTAIERDPQRTPRQRRSSPTATSGASAFSKVLLAHVATTSPGPLTRSQYNALVHVGSPSRAGASGYQASAAADDALRETILRRRRGTEEQQGSEDADEQRQAERERLRLCVVCCFEERTIICWPCRCLALCDGCREELASRPGYSTSGAGSVGGTFNCPTCRAQITGFSRVYLP